MSKNHETNNPETVVSSVSVPSSIVTLPTGLLSYCDKENLFMNNPRSGGKEPLKTLSVNTLVRRAPTNCGQL